MKRLIKLLTISTFVFCVMISGCVLIESGSISNGIPGGQKVTANSSDYGVLMLTAPYGVTHTANQMLAAKCQSGKVGNIQTELSMRNWFFIVQVYDVTATGVCQ